MTKAPEITRDNFEQLLGWLDPSRDRAAEKYESIRSRLIKIFYARGCFAAEELADETIDRVTKKSGDLSSTYTGDPALFFYGVAKNLILESRRKPRFEELPRTISSAIETEPDDEYSDCLDRCLGKLERRQHDMIITYYQGEKQEKIRRRKMLQEELGITGEALRVRVLRIRGGLQKCVLTCVASRNS